MSAALRGWSLLFRRLPESRVTLRSSPDVEIADPWVVTWVGERGTIDDVFPGESGHAGLVASFERAVAMGSIGPRPDHVVVPDRFVAHALRDALGEVRVDAVEARGVHPLVAKHLAALRIVRPPSRASMFELGASASDIERIVAAARAFDAVAPWRGTGTARFVAELPGGDGVEPIAIHFEDGGTRGLRVFSSDADLHAVSATPREELERAHGDVGFVDIAYVRASHLPRGWRDEYERLAIGPMDDGTFVRASVLGGHPKSRALLPAEAKRLVAALEVSTARYGGQRRSWSEVPRP